MDSFCLSGILNSLERRSILCIAGPESQLRHQSPEDREENRGVGYSELIVI